MWQPERWLDEFRSAVEDRDWDTVADLRAAVFQSTADIVVEREYAVDGRTVPLDAEREYDALHGGTVMYTDTDALQVAEPDRGRFETSVDVVARGCLGAARELSERGLDPVVLNMASRQNPGGGVLHGAGAQEESLFRQSNLLHSLYQFVDYGVEYGVPRTAGQSYPIERRSGGIYSPDAAVFRSGERTGYALLPEPYELSFVTVPALNRPPLEERGELLWLTEEMGDATKRKIRAILRISARHGHDGVVLSAFGCGAFQNPPHHMATLFAETFDEPEFQGAFRKLRFAIIDDHNAHRRHNPEGNLVPFLARFGSR